MLYIRRVVGESMSPGLRPGQIVIVFRQSRQLRVGDILVISHDGREKIKRVTQLMLDKIYVEGDNKLRSTDSRHFGWLSSSAVRGKVIWPRQKTTNKTNQTTKR